MDKKNSQKLILNIINFYTLFNAEFIDLIPDISNSDITPLLSKILHFIHFQGATTSSTISKNLNITVPNTSRSINVLFNLGYIFKKQDQKDKRIIYLSLSPKALKLLSLRNIETEETFLKKFNVLSSEEIEVFSESLHKLEKLIIKVRDLNKNQLNEK